MLETFAAHKPKRHLLLGNLALFRRETSLLRLRFKRLFVDQFDQLLHGRRLILGVVQRSRHLSHQDQDGQILRACRSNVAQCCLRLLDHLRIGSDPGHKVGERA